MPNNQNITLNLKKSYQLLYFIYCIQVQTGHFLFRNIFQALSLNVLLSLKVNILLIKKNLINYYISYIAYKHKPRRFCFIEIVVQALSLNSLKVNILFFLCSYRKFGSKKQEEIWICISFIFHFLNIQVLGYNFHCLPVRPK